MILFSYVIAACFFFYGGIFLSSSVGASTCNDIQEPEFNLVGAIFGKSILAADECDNDRYMGGMWGLSEIPIYIELDSSTLKSSFLEGINYWNSDVTFFNFRTLNSSVGSEITVYDLEYPSETWNARAYGSSAGMEKPDPNDPNDLYENLGGVDIRYNTSTKVQFKDKQTLYGIANHEIGHSVGLGHRDSQSLLMYCFNSRTATELTLGDATYLKYIYNQ